MLRNITLLLLFINFQSVHSQEFSISGFVEDKNTGERIIGAYVTDTISKQITQTNNFGFYNLKKSGNKAAIHASFLGMKSEIINLSLQNDTTLNIWMHPVKELAEVLIVSSQYEQNVNAPLGLITIPVTQLTSIPALGESDLLKSIQNLPGIKGGVEGSAGIFVRGGSGGENLFMLDDVPMYNVSHLYGFFSAFNSNAVKDIKIIKGSFPARYGGRVSSVIDVRSRDGNNKSIKGEISLGIISAKFTLEGPLFSNKTTFIASGRRSYFDLYSGTLKNLDILDENFPGYYFYDMNMRVTHSLSRNNKIYLSIYRGKDKIQNKYESIISDSSQMVTEENVEVSGWGNLIGSFRWNHIFGKYLFSNTTIAYSDYDFYINKQYKYSCNDLTIDSVLENSYYANYCSGISDFIVKTDFDFSLSDNHRVLFGSGNILHLFNPGNNIYIVNNPELNQVIDTVYKNLVIYANEPFMYFEDEIKFLQKLKINAGVRFTGSISESGTNFNIEPRLSTNYSILPQLVLKAGYSRMIQYLHLLSTSGVTMPTDIWVPALKGLKPLKSDQINAGFSYEWNDKILLSVEAYLKWLLNTTDFKSGISLLTNLSPWYEKTIQGRGDTKGIEISLKKQYGDITGSINYTLSTASRKYSDLNKGKTFPFRYDRLNDFNISINYKISEKLDISVIWLYGTGYPVTVPVEKYSPALGIIPGTICYYPSINNYRLPAYHRLDLSLDYRISNRLGESILSIDIFNTYNRKNPINMYYWQSYEFQYVYLLPIIPSVTYTLKF